MKVLFVVRAAFALKAFNGHTQVILIFKCQTHTKCHFETKTCQQQQQTTSNHEFRQTHTNTHTQTNIYNCIMLSVF